MDKQTQRNLYLYFYHLNEELQQAKHDETEYHRFCANWQRLKNCNFDGKEQGVILQKTAVCLQKRPATFLKKRCLDYVRGHFSVWTNLNFFANKPNASDMGKVLATMIKLNVTPSQDFVETLEQRFFKQNPNAHNMAKTLRAMAKLNFTPSQDFIETLEQRFFKQNPNSADIAGTLWAMSQLGITPSQNFIETLERHLNFVTQKPRTRDITGTLETMVKLGITPSHDFIKTIEQHFFSQYPSARDMTNTLWAMAKLSIVPSQAFIETFEQHLLKQNPSSADMSKTIWAYAVLDSLDNKKIYKNFAETLHEHIQKKGLPTEKGIMQTKTACMWFDIDIPLKIKKTKDTISREERLLRDTFNTAGFETRDDIWQEKLGRRPDFTLINGMPMNVEIDGYHHFVQKSDRSAMLYNGSTLFHTALVLKLYSDALILRLPYPTGSKILEATPNKQRVIIGSLVDQTRSFGPGNAVAAHMNGHTIPKVEILGPALAI